MTRFSICVSVVAMIWIEILSYFNRCVARHRSKDAFSPFKVYMTIVKSKFGLSIEKMEKQNESAISIGSERHQVHSVLTSNFNWCCRNWIWLIGNGQKSDVTIEHMETHQVGGVFLLLLGYTFLTTVSSLIAKFLFFLTNFSSTSFPIRSRRHRAALCNGRLSSERRN